MRPGSERSQPSPATRRRRAFRRGLARHRRWTTALLLAISVVAGLAALSPPEAPVEHLVVAAHDLAAGTVLGAGDLAVVSVPAASVPVAGLRDPQLLAGRSVAAAMRRGEPFTDVRLVGPALLTATAGLVAAPVRLADAAAAALLRPGDVVDVLAAAGGDVNGVGAGSPGFAQVVAGAARILAVPEAADAESGLSGTDGALVVLAVTASTALELAGAAASMRLSVTIR